MLKYLSILEKFNTLLLKQINKIEGKYNENIFNNIILS